MLTEMTIDTMTRPALASGTFRIGGDLPVVRLGYGAMRITGPVQSLPAIPTPTATCTAQRRPSLRARGPFFLAHLGVSTLIQPESES
jgi:hypothetical protein